MEKTLIIALITIWSTSLDAQTVIPNVTASNGNSFKNESLQVDWTLGELAVTPIQNSSTLITQGFHQPYYVISSIDALDKSIGKVELYPNPTVDYLEVKLSFDDIRFIEIILLDAKGNTILKQYEEGQNIVSSLSLRTLPNGIYFVTFTDIKNLSFQTFKIQKLN